MPCTHCSVPIALLGDKVISTWSTPPLHAKDCARALFNKYQLHFQTEMLKAVIPDGAVDVNDLGFDF